MWEGKVFAAANADADADAAETDWKHKVTPERGDLIMLIKQLHVLWIKKFNFINTSDEYVAYIIPFGYTWHHSENENSL